MFLCPLHLTRISFAMKNWIFGRILMIWSTWYNIRRKSRKIIVWKEAFLSVLPELSKTRRLNFNERIYMDSWQKEEDFRLQNYQKRRKTNFYHFILFPFC